MGAQAEGGGGAEGGQRHRWPLGKRHVIARLRFPRGRDVRAAAAELVAGAGEGRWELVQHDHADVIAAYVRAGRPAEGVRHYRRYSGTLPGGGDPYVYAAAVSACGQAGGWQEAVGLLREAVARCMPWVPTVVNAAVSACASAARWALGLGLLRQARLADAPPDAVGFNAAISACGKAAEWRSALGLAAAMEPASLRPDQYTATTAAAACGAAAQWRAAFRTVQRLRSAGAHADSGAFAAAISACRAAHGNGDLQGPDALERVGELLAAAGALRVPRTAVLLNAAAGACGACEGSVEAVGVMETLGRRRVYAGGAATPGDKCLGAALHATALARTQRWRQALARVAQVPERERDAVLSAAALSAAARGEQWAGALGLLRGMRRRAAARDAACCNAVLTACVAAERHGAALSIFERMAEADSAEPSAVTHSVVAIACSGAARWEQALGALRGLRRAPAVPGRESKQEHSCVAAMSACIRCSVWQAALGVYASMPAHGIPQDEATGNALFAALEAGTQVGGAQLWRQALSLRGRLGQPRRWTPRRPLAAFLEHAGEKPAALPALLRGPLSKGIAVSGLKARRARPATTRQLMRAL
eukprot:TRINITY_DN21714_c0_g1_i1.p1 TRINITY_DN21714_c0_g1~~TRINITY_DN21714_c0_g1_i1.p1  ORF type:complete len:609 (+),score=154.79 TRINITY_DN21714_c0_g1_i1:51-1829(+)